MAPLGSRSQHFSLSWEKYQEVMCDGFSNLQQTGEFVDMTIAADGHLVKVHRMLVSLASPYLRELIQSAPCPHPVIFLNNISHQTLCSILEYVYTGEVAVVAENLTTFIETAKALHIRGLEDMMPDHKPPTVPLVEYCVEPTQVSSINVPPTARNVIIRQEMPSTSPVSERIRTSARPDASRGETPVAVGWQMSSGESTQVVTSESVLPVDCKQNIHVFEYMESNDSVEDDTDADNNDDSFKLEANVSTAQHAYQQVTENSSATGLPAHTELQYTVSNRGALQLILNRYMYNLSSRSRNGLMRRWKCVEYRNHKCPATCTTEENAVVSRIAMHNHPFHDKKIMGKIERKAVFTAISHAEEATKTIQENSELESND